MQKFLMGTFVLTGLLIVNCSQASAKDRPPPRRSPENESNLQDEVSSLKNQLQSMQNQLEFMQQHSRQPAPPQHAPIHQNAHSVHHLIQHQHPSGSSFVETLERIRIEKQREREDRELAEALQCLLDKAKPKGYPCGCATPACEYAKPTCAPLQCVPAPCSVFSR